MSDAILEARDLRLYYPIARSLAGLLRRAAPRRVHALDGVSFSLQRGEILGLVGESGSGKTSAAMCLMGLAAPTSGYVLYEGRPLLPQLKGPQRLIARRQVQMVFQDPYGALNPRQTVRQIVAEPLEIHRLASGPGQREARVRAALEDAGLRPAENYLDRYPEALSGGQRQRVVIAAALVLEPRVLVADEPVSMLDVSVRAELLQTLRDLRDKKGISIVYITHDLATAGYFTDRIAVMYLGRIVEIGPTPEVLALPRHPYTRALLSVIPVPNPRQRRKREVLRGEIPDPIDLPIGCRFHPRCPDARKECLSTDPALRPANGDHEAACILIEHSV